jgi:hypothetical protein
LPIRGKRRAQKRDRLPAMGSTVASGPLATLIYVDPAESVTCARQLHSAVQDVEQNPKHIALVRQHEMSRAASPPPAEEGAVDARGL